jgi:hypothetical protein
VLTLGHVDRDELDPILEPFLGNGDANPCGIGKTLAVIDFHVCAPEVNLPISR